VAKARVRARARNDSSTSPGRGWYAAQVKSPHQSPHRLGRSARIPEYFIRDVGEQGKCVVAGRMSSSGGEVGQGEAAAKVEGTTEVEQPRAA
jgi:hypothetical protein